MKTRSKYLSELESYSAVFRLRNIKEIIQELLCMNGYVDDIADLLVIDEKHAINKNQMKVRCSDNGVSIEAHFSELATSI